MATRTWFKAKHPPTIPPEFYAPLGRIFAGWTYTELYLQSITWKICKVRNAKQARLLTWGRNAREITDVFANIERWVPAAEKAEHAELSAEAERIRTARNRFAHGLWGYKPAEKPRLWRVFYLRDVKHKLDPKPHKYTPREVETLANDLDALNVRLKALHKRLRAPVP